MIGNHHQTWIEDLYPGISLLCWLYHIHMNLMNGSIIVFLFQTVQVEGY